MNREVPAAVVLPDKYAADPGAEWPLVVVLHGAGGNYLTYGALEIKQWAADGTLSRRRISYDRDTGVFKAESLEQ